MPIYNPPTQSTGGSGITGPETSTTNHVALFADGTGAVLLDGGALGTSASLDVGTGSGEVAAGDHTHVISDTTGLQAALDAKAADSALTTHTSNTSNPHSVTKTQVGLGNCDNTSDASKPVSTATQTALDGKSSTSHTHDLSTSDVTGTLATTKGGTGQTSLSNSVQSFLNDISSTQGAVLYKGASSWSALATGTSGQFLQTQGSGANPAWANDKIELVVAISDETTALTTGTAKVTFRMPCAMTLTDVRASVTTAPTGSTLIIDIKESGTTIFSTKLSIDASAKTSTTAATPKVLSDTSLADDAEITINIDQIGSTIAGAGAKITLIGTRV